MDKAKQVLTDVFDFPAFRGLQEQAIRRLLVDQDNACVVFPTGGGKSLTYQIPALCLDGITLVISPLISLMKDQVEALVKRGVKAAQLDSTLDMAQANFVKDEVRNGNLKLLYVAPERLNNEGFLAMMQHVEIALLAVDEAHCISQWGASFRPEYLKIARFAEENDVQRVICLTATATPAVVRDICTSFLIKDEAVYKTPIVRPNLHLGAVVAETLDDKLTVLIPALKARTGPVIIYVTLQKHCDEVVNHLMPHGLLAMGYHAGMPSEAREQVQTMFMASDDAIIVATIAFGMGVDKANVRAVYHLFMPKTLENYSQEVGRAGRDGLVSNCVTFLSSRDLPILEGFVRGDTCNKTDLALWIQEVAMKPPTSDGHIAFYHYGQSKQYDIRPNVLGLLYAQLELDYGYIRAVTPFYAVYSLTQRDAAGWAKVMQDKSPAAVAIRNVWSLKTGKFNAEIDVVLAATRSAKIEREDISRKITSWDRDGYITTTPAQPHARYKVLNPLPKDHKEVAELANKLYEGMLKREQEGVNKIKDVVNFVTDDDCFASALSTYFGDSVEALCGNCTFCRTGEGIVFKPKASGKPKPADIKKILNACPERDDPRLLARMAFGITSPRLTANKWSTSHPLFGSLVDYDFNALVEAFTTECDRVGGVRDEAVAAMVASTGRSLKRTSSSSFDSYPAKRSYSSNTSSGSSYRGRGRGRGGYSKRY